MKEWNAPKWFAQIRTAVESELGVTLKLGQSISWAGIENEEKSEIEKI